MRLCGVLPSHLTERETTDIYIARLASESRHTGTSASVAGGSVAAPNNVAQFDAAVGADESRQTVAQTGSVAGPVVLAGVRHVTDPVRTGRTGKGRDTLAAEGGDLVDAGSAVLARRAETLVDFCLTVSACDKG